jgi:hypothetical protein
MVEHLDMPGTARASRALGAAGDRVGDVLAGRTVWCAAALPDARPNAAELRACIEGAGTGMAAEAVGGSADLVGEWVGSEDVLVAHDAPSALLARVVRESGAHTVWRLRVGMGTEGSAPVAIELLGRGPGCVDAYLVSWAERGPRGELVECVAAAMPSAGIVAAKEFPSPSLREELRRLAWGMALAEIVRSDRGEAVGGTLHARPTIAAR